MKQEQLVIEIKAKIIILVKEVAIDQEYPNKLWIKKDEKELTITSQISDVDKDCYERLEIDKIGEMIELGIKMSFEKMDFVYVYICRDNYVVSFEYGYKLTDEWEGFKEHLMTTCDEVIKDKYYEGWD